MAQIRTNPNCFSVLNQAYRYNLFFFLLLDTWKVILSRTKPVSGRGRLRWKRRHSTRRSMKSWGWVSRACCVHSPDLKWTNNIACSNNAMQRSNHKWLLCASITVSGSQGVSEDPDAHSFSVASWYVWQEQLPGWGRPGPIYLGLRPHPDELLGPQSPGTEQTPSHIYTDTHA